MNWLQGLAVKLITAIVSLGAIALAFFTVSKSGENKGKAEQQLKQHRANDKAAKEARKIREEVNNLSDDELADRM